jgi:hypothetical protein
MRVLLELAAKRFDVLLTVDRNLEYQQDFSAFALAVVVIHSPEQRLLPIFDR